jgi:hypothetical protein
MIVATDDLLETSAIDCHLADEVFARVFRREFTQSGVALIRFTNPISSAQLRQAMVHLKELLDARFFQHTRQRLNYLSLGRFDQQASTKFHIDGSPDEAYLMLGYEPTAVDSAVSIADYTKAAHDWGMTPKTLLDAHNPMYAANEDRLRPYARRLQHFDRSASQILLINNSSLPYHAGENSLGVMHQATILTPMPQQPRWVNSTMIGVRAADEAETMDHERLQEFLRM